METKALEACTMLYDGECKLCQSAVEVLAQNKRAQALEMISYQSKEGKALLASKGISEEEASAALIVINQDTGQIHKADDAIIQAGLQSEGMPYWGARLLKVIPADFRAWAYKQIAKRRKQIW